MTYPTYADVIFMSGDEADSVLDMLDNDGPHAALIHLTDWDYGDGQNTRDLPPWGDDDRLHEADLDGLRYVMSWHHGLRYVSLTRVDYVDDADHIVSSAVETACWLAVIDDGETIEPVTDVHPDDLPTDVLDDIARDVSRALVGLSDSLGDARYGELMRRLAKRNTGGDVLGFLGYELMLSMTGAGAGLWEYGAPGSAANRIVTRYAHDRSLVGVLDDDGRTTWSWTS